MGRSCGCRAEDGWRGRAGVHQKAVGETHTVRTSVRAEVVETGQAGHSIATFLDMPTELNCEVKKRKSLGDTKLFPLPGASLLGRGVVTAGRLS